MDGLVAGYSGDGVVPLVSNASASCHPLIVRRGARFDKTRWIPGRVGGRLRLGLQTTKGTRLSVPFVVACCGAYFFLVAGFFVSTFFAVGFFAVSFLVVAVAMVAIPPVCSDVTAVNAMYRYREKHCQEKKRITHPSFYGYQKCGAANSKDCCARAML
jgi:hypothetical protein